MKNLWERFDTSVIAFFAGLVLSAATAFYDIRLALIQVAFVVIFAVSKFFFTKRKKEKLLYQAKTFSKLLDYKTSKTWGDLTVACCVIESDGNILWLNDKFAESFDLDETVPLTNIQSILQRQSIEKVIAGRGFHIKVGSKYFSVYSNDIETENGSNYLLYFFDETKLRLTEKEYYDTRPSIMLAVIDNSDELYQNFKESECSAIFSEIQNIIDEWVTSYGGLCRKFSDARRLIIVEERGLSKMIGDKFSVLDKIRNLTYGDRPCELTLSIGVGREGDYSNSNNSARQALDMAQSRGGDQVAIKHEAQYKFYGGVSQGFEKKNKVRTRLIAKTIANIIKDSDNVLIMGHRFSDFDSFGSAAGIYCIARHFGAAAKIAVDLKTTLAKPLIKKFPDFENMIIDPSKVGEFLGENTLLVVVDTHKKDFTECPELVDKAKKIMVIDHHRKSAQFIENTVVFYHMPNSSSTCEMVTELTQYVDSKPFIDPITAQALLSGIILDTRNFVLRTGTRTFEAAGYLRSRNANTVEAKKLFSNDMDIFRLRNAVIDNAETYKEVCAVSVFDGESKNIRLITSQAADEMLNIDGIKASFVLYKNKNETDVSARSFGEINVQLIMESLGGGGHQSMSACQMPDTSLEEAKEKLLKAIDKYLQGG